MESLLETGRRLAEIYNAQGEGFKNMGRKNAYECEACASYIVTIDRHPGVTPFMIKCERCGQMAKSKFYRVQEWLEPTHEWYRPDDLEGIDPAYFDHLGRGGLVLRPIDGKGWQSVFEMKRDIDPYAENRALNEMMERPRKADVAGEIVTRQQRRHKSRKHREAPEEIQMYGHRYRLIKDEPHDQP